MKCEEKIEIRVCIKVRVALQISPKEIFAEMCHIYGSSGVNLRTVFHWVKKFHRGQCSLKDSNRPGMPVVAATKEKHWCHEAYGQYTISKIGILEGTVHHILADCLKLNNLCNRWASYMYTLTPDQKSKGLECSKKKNCWKKYKNCNPNKISEFLTGDENWVNSFEPSDA